MQLTIPLEVVIPACNEEAGIPATLEDLRSHVLDRIPGSVCLFVDDGSQDRTGWLLDQAAQADGRIRVIHQENQGHGAALRRGLRESRGHRLLLLDADRQIDLQSVERHYRMAIDHDLLIFGVRRPRRDPLHRRVLSCMMREAIRVLFNVRPADGNCPYKIIPRSLWLRTDELLGTHDVIPSLLLAITAFWMRLPLREIPVVHRPRLTGRPSLRFFRLAGFCVRGFGDLLVHRRALRSFSGKGSHTVIP